MNKTSSNLDSKCSSLTRYLCGLSRAKSGWRADGIGLDCREEAGLRIEPGRLLKGKTRPEHDRLDRRHRHVQGGCEQRFEDLLDNAPFSTVEPSTGGLER